jgi:hypothetical protein
MAKPFNELRERLLGAGVAPRHVRRYLGELGDHLADLKVEEERAGRSGAESESAALARLGGVDDLARAMIEQRQFQSLCGRAPWAVFGLGPLLLLAAAWFVACFILWTGWKIFMPEASTPFVPVSGVAIFYFGMGRLIYFGAPVFIGWGISLIAARQRLKPVWPAAGLVLMALIAPMAQVHANRPFVSGEAGHISMVFAMGQSLQDFSFWLLRALAILTLTALPYLIWRLQKARSVPS